MSSQNLGQFPGLEAGSSRLQGADHWSDSLIESDVGPWIRSLVRIAELYRWLGNNDLNQ
jgi:hypothetical protein